MEEKTVLYSIFFCIKNIIMHGYVVEQTVIITKLYYED